MKKSKHPENAKADITETAVLTETPSESATNAPRYGEKILTKTQKRNREIKRWVMLIVGIIMMSISVYFFQAPNDFTLGGVAGIAIVVNRITPAAEWLGVDWLSQGMIMLYINIFLIIVGLIILGKQCTLRTIFCSLAYTGIILILEHFDVIGLINQAAGRFLTDPATGEFILIANPETGEMVKQTIKTLTDEPFLELVYAILLFGIGGALIFNCGASSGGTDIIALILKKFTSLNVGMALMLIDFIVVCISFYTFTTVSALFSLMGLFTKSFLLDSVIESIGKTKYITIITSNPDVISEYILTVINHGYTKYDAEGGYTGEPKKVIVTVCKRGEALKIKNKVKEVDPTSFVIINDAKEILGKGFGETV